MTLTGAADTWFGIGFNTAPSMAGSDVVVFEPAYAGGPEPGSQVNAYTLVSGYTYALVSEPPLSSVSVVRSEAGAVQVNFTRFLAAGAYAGAVAVPAAGQGFIMWAVGYDGAGSLAAHPSTQRGAMQSPLLLQGPSPSLAPGLPAGPAGASGNGAVVAAGTVALAPTLTMAYEMDAAVISTSLTYSGSMGSWFATGYSASPNMAGADVVVVEPGAPAGASQVSVYTLSANSAAGLSFVPSPPLLGVSVADITVPAASASAAAGGGGRLLVGSAPALQVNYSRYISGARAGFAGAVSAPTTGGGGYVIFALGAAGVGTVAGNKHASAGAFSCDLAAGADACKAVPAPWAQRVAHGVLMFLAWGALAPAGVAMSRYGRALPPTGGPAACWFVSHWMLMAAAWTCSLAGFALIVAVTPAGAHFESAHARVGLTVFILGFLQPLNANKIVRPKKAPGAPVSRARRAWELGHKAIGYAALCMGVAAIALGLLDLSAPAGLIGAYAAFASLAGAAALAAEAVGVWSRKQAAPLPLTAKPPVEHLDDDDDDDGAVALPAGGGDLAATIAAATAAAEAATKGPVAAATAAAAAATEAAKAATEAAAAVLLAASKKAPPPPPPPAPAPAAAPSPAPATALAPQPSIKKSTSIRLLPLWMQRDLLSTSDEQPTPPGLRPVVAQQLLPTPLAPNASRLLDGHLSMLSAYNSTSVGLARQQSSRRSLGPTLSR